MVHILLKAKEKGYLCAEAMDPAEGDLVMVNGKGKCTVLKRMGMRLRVEVEETGKPSWSEVKDVVEILNGNSVEASSVPAGAAPSAPSRLTCVRFILILSSPRIPPSSSSRPPLIL